MVDISAVAAGWLTAAVVRLMRGRELLDHRRLQQQVDEVRVELRPSLSSDFHCRSLSAARAAVMAAIRDDVERISNRRNACEKRNAAAGKPPGIAFSIPPFVVGQNAHRQLWIEWLQWREHVRSAPWMREDCAPLLGRQVCAVVHDVQERFMNLADVVEERDALDGSHVAIVEVSGVAEDEGVASHPTEVLARLVIGGFDSVQECFERCGSEAFATFSASMFEAEEAQRSEKQSIAHRGRTGQEAWRPEGREFHP
jgi:hypothetical protein